MKPVDLMIFDFDGTLADTGADLVQSVNHTLAMMKLETKSYDEIIGFVGDGVRKLIEKSLGADFASQTDEALNIFSAHYEKHMLDQTTLYPNIEDVLLHFQHKKKVILTNKRYYLTLAIARTLKIEKYFMEIVGADSTPYMKPDGRVVEYLLAKYDADPKRSVMIGDGVNDIAVAKDAGILSCIYLNGLGRRHTLLPMAADFYCDDLSDIKTLFE